LLDEKEGKEGPCPRAKEEIGKKVAQFPAVFHK
jgi:hypothetical protein